MLRAPCPLHPPHPSVNCAARLYSASKIKYKYTNTRTQMRFKRGGWWGSLTHSSVWMQTTVAEGKVWVRRGHNKAGQLLSFLFFGRLYLSNCLCVAAGLKLYFYALRINATFYLLFDVMTVWKKKIESRCSGQGLSLSTPCGSRGKWTCDSGWKSSCSTMTWFIYFFSNTSSIKCNLNWNWLQI